MATIQNARDVLLQAAAQRTVTVNLPPNVVVPSDQVPGLPDTIASTRRIDLQSSSLVFQISKAGVVSPASITLTPKLYNLAGVPTLSVVDGVITGDPPLPLVNGVATLNPASMVTDSVTIRATVVVNEVTYRADTTLTKIREGLDSVYMSISSEGVIFPADATGTVTSYAGNSAKVSLWKGGVDETELWTLSSVNSTGVTAAPVTPQGVVTVTELSTANDTGSVTVTAVRDGHPTLTRTFNVMKGRQGALGPRGSMIFYVSTSATAWSDTLANQTSNVNGGKTLNDQVTQFNNASKWAETRFWNGNAWVVVNAVINGNLLVSGSVGASAMSVAKLSAIAADMGDITAGKLTSVTVESSTVKAGKVLGGAFTAWAWPAAGNYGYYLGPEGLLMGNANNGKYFQVTADGNMYSPGFSVVDGVMTVNTANVIDTLNIRGNAVTTTVSAYTAGGVGSVAQNVEIQSVGINLAGNSTVTVFVTASMSHYSPNTYPFSLRILRDGVVIYSTSMNGSRDPQPLFFSCQLTDAVGAGYHTYSAEMTGTGDGSVSAEARSIIVMEIKR